MPSSSFLSSHYTQVVIFLIIITTSYFHNLSLYNVCFFFFSLSLESSSSSSFSHYPSCSELFVRMRSFFSPFLIPIPIITLDYSKWPGFLVTYLLPIPISLEEQRKWQATCWMKRRATFSLLSFPTFEKKEWVININFIFQPLSLSLQFFLFLSIKEWGNRNSSNKTLCLFLFCPLKYICTTFPTLHFTPPHTKTF